MSLPLSVSFTEPVTMLLVSSPLISAIARSDAALASRSVFL